MNSTTCCQPRRPTFLPAEHNHRRCRCPQTLPCRGSALGLLAAGCLAVALLPAGLVSAADDLLPTASPESQGVRSAALRELSQHVRKHQYDVRAMILLRHGKMVFEWYPAGVTRQHNHNIYSVTKSVTSTLAGIAVDRGQLPGADATLGELLPESEAVRHDARKAAITLADLLTMRSGLPSARANRPSGPVKELFNKIHRAPDRLNFILNLPVEREPGKHFLYGNAEPQLVLCIVEQATGQKALPLAEKVLFGPLGFQNYQWHYADRKGSVPGGYGLRLRAVDLARLGQMYLQGGTWQDRRVLSQNWIDQATSNLTGTGYGYYWWTDIPVGKYQTYAAKGVRGQRIQVVPELDLVFVATANLSVEDLRAFFAEAIPRVVNAAQPTGALPEQPEELSTLSEELSAAARYLPPGRAGLDAASLPQLPK